MASSLNFCSRCGTALEFGVVEGEDRERLACPSCGHIAYVNPRLVVTVFPITEAGEIVLIRRGIEPGKGWWAQPGGFLEVDETVNQAAIRETWEETGLLVEPGEIIGLYTRLEAAVVTIAFEARIVGGLADPDPRGDRDHGLRPRGHPVVRDRLLDDDLGPARLAGSSPPRPALARGRQRRLSDRPGAFLPGAHLERASVDANRNRRSSRLGAGPRGVRGGSVTTRRGPAAYQARAGCLPGWDCGGVPAPQVRSMKTFFVSV